MKKFFKLGLLIIFISLLACGCTKKGLISYMSAKEKIINNHAVLLDVRTAEEYNSGHIDGAYNLSVNDITSENVMNIIDSTDREIIVYCNDGSKSKKAVSLLNNLGYNKVYDLGSIDNWEE